MGEKVGELGENTNVFWGGLVVGGVDVGCVGVKVGESGESTQRSWGGVLVVVVGVSRYGGGVSIESGTGAASAHCTPSSSSDGDGGMQATAQRSPRVGVVDGESMSESGSKEGDGGEHATAQRSSRNCFVVVGDTRFGGVAGVGCVVASALTSSIAEWNIAERPLDELGVGVGVVLWGWAGDACLK